jgi:hypothetical protein
MASRNLALVELTDERGKTVLVRPDQVAALTSADSSDDGDVHYSTLLLNSGQVVVVIGDVATVASVLEGMPGAALRDMRRYIEAAKRARGDQS